MHCQRLTGDPQQGQQSALLQLHHRHQLGHELQDDFQPALNGPAGRGHPGQHSAEMQKGASSVLDNRLGMYDARGFALSSGYDCNKAFGISCWVARNVGQKRLSLLHNANEYKAGGCVLHTPRTQRAQPSAVHARAKGSSSGVKSNTSSDNSVANVCTC